jgi:hypothetical protein
VVRRLSDIREANERNCSRRRRRNDADNKHHYSTPPAPLDQRLSSSAATAIELLMQGRHSRHVRLRLAFGIAIFVMFTFNRAGVDEHIFSSINRDEAPFRIVEPL